MKTLDQIALEHGTDKSSKHHGYTAVYEKYFGPFRETHFRLLELGAGGYHFLDRGFNGAETWAEYFPNANIITIDKYTKIPPTNPRIKFYQGSQNDIVFLSKVCTSVGNPKVIIDDASHISPMTIASFSYLWPLLLPGGIYVIEDLEASYWKEASDGTDFGGGIDNRDSSLNYIKDLVDSINHKYCGMTDIGIDSIHFYEKIAFIFKKP